MRDFGRENHARTFAAAGEEMARTIYQEQSFELWLCRPALQRREDGPRIPVAITKTGVSSPNATHRRPTPSRVSALTMRPGRARARRAGSRALLPRIQWPRSDPRNRRGSRAGWLGTRLRRGAPSDR